MFKDKNNINLLNVILHLLKILFIEAAFKY